MPWLAWVARSQAHAVWRGGPLHQADEIGLADILPQTDDPAPLLREFVSSSRRFADLNR